MSGSVGQFTFKRMGGATVVSEKVTNVTNPRTASQQNQRTKWGNLVRLYSGISPLLNLAFENKPPRVSDYNMFIKLNIASAEVRLTKAEVAAKACVAAPCIVSLGSLPTIEMTGNAGESVTNISLGSLTIDSNTTIGDFAKAVVNNNDNFNFGDQIAFLIVRQSVNPITGYPQCTFSGERVTLDKSYTLKLRDAVSAAGFSVKSGKLACQLDSSFQGSYVWIQSRSVNGKTLVSTQVMVMKNDIYADYAGGEAYTRSVNSYGGQNNNFLTPVGSASANGSTSGDANNGGSSSGGSNDSGSDSGIGSQGGGTSSGGEGDDGEVNM